MVAGSRRSLLVELVSAGRIGVHLANRCAKSCSDRDTMPYQMSGQIITGNSLRSIRDIGMGVIDWLIYRYYLAEGSY